MQTTFESSALPDVQSSGDRRNVAINKVGVKAVRYPITLRTPGKGIGTGTQTTVASINMYVALPPEVKGTHMSRFLEVLNEHHESLCSDRPSLLVQEAASCVTQSGLLGFVATFHFTIGSNRFGMTRLPYVW